MASSNALDVLIWPVSKWLGLALAVMVLLKLVQWITLAWERRLAAPVGLATEGAPAANARTVAPMPPISLTRPNRSAPRTSPER